MKRENPEKEEKTLAGKMFEAIDVSYMRADHKIICPVCGNVITKITLGETCWDYVCQTEGCIHERVHGL